MVFIAHNGSWIGLFLKFQGEVLSFPPHRILLVATALIVGAATLSAVESTKPSRHKIATRTARKPAAPIAPLIATTRSVRKATRTVARASVKASLKARIPRGPWRVPTFA